jgi:hypothetical protein
MALEVEVAAKGHQVAGPDGVESIPVSGCRVGILEEACPSGGAATPPWLTAMRAIVGGEIHHAVDSREVRGI